MKKCQSDNNFDPFFDTGPTTTTTNGVRSSAAVAMIDELLIAPSTPATESKPESLVDIWGTEFGVSFFGKYIDSLDFASCSA